MAFKYGGEVNTKSIDRLLIRVLRASPNRMTTGRVASREYFSGTLAKTTSTAAINLENGKTGAFEKCLCGLLCTKSSALDAPRLAMINRDSAHQSKFRIERSRIRPMTADSANT